MENIRKLLIVDDEELMRTMLSQFFSNHNFEVFVAAGSDGVLEMIEEHAIQIMIIDLKLLHESGIDLGKAITHRFPITVRIAMTGYPSAYELQEAREVGFDDYFRKPLNLETLLQRVENATLQVERWLSRI